MYISLVYFAADKDGDIDLSSVLVLHKRQMMPYFVYRMMNSDKDDDATVTQYAKFVGKTCAQRMLLYRQ